MLIPLRIEWCDPKKLGTADASAVCRCEDGLFYFVKDDPHGRRTPHNEWFCTHLAQHVGIACPPCAVLIQRDGTHAFGSRCEGGLASDPWWDMISRGDIDFSNIKPLLSRILAFDSFVYNDDRHLNNFLVRTQHIGFAFIAMDFSRSWKHHGFPLPDLPFASHSNTIKASRLLRSRFGEYIILDEIDELLSKILGIDESTVEYILAAQPDDWLTSVESDTILSWWRSPARSSRIQGIMQGVRDGTFL